METRKLPIGVQSFEVLRNEGYLYVDKTEHIWNLVQNGRVYFLSRPRRFGKSLFVSTMEAYFQGRKDLFEGLAISTLEDIRGDSAWLEYPVIRFSLSGGDYHSEDGLAKTLELTLADVEARYGIDTDGLDLSNRFRVILRQAHKKTGLPVVVLVDEYDKPLLVTMGEEQEKRNRQLYKGFFSVLKDEDEHLKFVFFTGVTKFSKVSIFSDLNQLKDISFSRQYADICGITEEELEEGFGPEIAQLAQAQGLSSEECLEKLAATYDGYHFSGGARGVYNPFSLLNAFSDREFGRYWFETGTPTFLIEKLSKSGFRPEQFVDGVEATEDELKDYRAENPNPIPLFYQSGYLTICGYDREFGLYELRFPNEEVRYGFLGSLVPYVLGEKDAETPWSARAMVLSLRKGDTDALKDQLFSLFASIPYVEGNAPEYESAWRNQIYLVFALLGQYVSCELHTSKGRCDCMVLTAGYVYVFEFKVDGSAYDALAQIERKGYAERFRADGRELKRIGAVFSSEERNIVEWKVA